MKDNPLLPRQAVIEEKFYVTENIVSLTFSIQDRQGFLFKPGQFNMLGIPGIGEAPISFSSLSTVNGRFEHTIRSAGNVTQKINQLNKNDKVYVRGPYGNGWPLEKTKGKNVII
ncbi:MAG: FAD-binding oxidoreductase, partial [bacterium]